MVVMGTSAAELKGNNNAYCQDNDTSWFNWSLVKTNEDLLRYVRTLIHFRGRSPRCNGADS